MNKLTAMLLTATVCSGLTAQVAHATPPPRAAPSNAGPNTAQCPAAPAVEADTNERKGPLPVPSRYAAIARSSHNRLAVLTLAGGNYCHDIHQISEARNFTLSADRRFFSFDWYGYEEGGHIVIDRSGRGQSVDTGAAPVFSPSRQRLAAVEYSESGFGSLNGFAVWQVAVTGLRSLTMLSEIPSLVDWRIDGWVGENCINLSGIPNSRIPPGSENWTKIPRDRYVARPAGTSWRLTRAVGRGCPAG